MLELYIPKMDDLWFHTEMMQNALTMEYNKGYEAYPGYHSDAGCNEFPEEKWGTWHCWMMNHEPERFYAYVQRKEDRKWIGEVCYHYTPESDWWDMGTVIHAPYRAMGYGVPALKLLLMSIPKEEWDEYGEYVMNIDPFHHLRSIHNCMAFYDHSKEWITHCSLQKIDSYKPVEETDLLIKRYNKPVVWDEIAYEGNIDMGWGNISMRGGCAGHGETYVHPEDILWWSHGGELHGASEPRIAFLKKLWDAVPGGYLDGIEQQPFDEVVAVPKGEKKVCNWIQTTWCNYELHYYGIGRPSYRMFNLSEDAFYQFEVIDTWDMCIIDAGIYSGLTRIDLPGKEYMAIRLTRV